MANAIENTIAVLIFLGGLLLGAAAMSAHLDLLAHAPKPAATVDVQGGYGCIGDDIMHAVMVRCRPSPDQTR